MRYNGRFPSCRMFRQACGHASGRSAPDDDPADLPSPYYGQHVPSPCVQSATSPSSRTSTTARPRSSTSSCARPAPSRAHERIAERVMDSNDLERERGITIFAKNTRDRLRGRTHQYRRHPRPRRFRRRSRTRARHGRWRAAAGRCGRRTDAADALRDRARRSRSACARSSSSTRSTARARARTGW